MAQLNCHDLRPERSAYTKVHFKPRDWAGVQGSTEEDGKTMHCRLGVEFLSDREFEIIIDKYNRGKPGLSHGPARRVSAHLQRVGHGAADGAGFVPAGDAGGVV